MQKEAATKKVTRPDKETFIVTVKKPNKIIQYLAKNNREYALVDSYIYAIRYETVKEAYIARNNLCRFLPEGTKIKVFPFKQVEKRNKYGRNAPQTTGKKKKQQDDRPRLTAQELYEMLQHREEIMEERRKQVLNPTVPFPKKVSVPNAETTQRDKVECWNCGVCRDCMDRIERFMSSIIKTGDF